MLRINTSSGRIEKSLDSVSSRGFKHIETHHGIVVENQTLIGHDIPHASHISSQVEYPIASLGRLKAVVDISQVKIEKLIVIVVIYVLSTNVGDDHVMTFSTETTSQVMSDEATASSHTNLHYCKITSPTRYLEF
jgi:hypothetical protein